MFIIANLSRCCMPFNFYPMKKQYTFSLILLLISLGIFAQDYTFKIHPQKPKRQERVSTYHKMLDSYQAFREHSLLKSAAEDSLSLDTAQIQFYLGEDQYLPIYNQRLYYDASGNLARLQDEWLNPDTYIWENNSRSDLSYDMLGNLTQTLNQDWDGSSSSWVPSNKAEYAYNTSNILNQITEYAWNESTNQLVLSSKVDITLDENNLQTQSLVSVWQASSSEWVEQWKYEYSYTANDDLFEETEFVWDPDLSDWVYSWKAQLSYDVSDMLILKEEFDWDIDTESWLSSWKSEYTYEGSSNVKDQTDSQYVDELWQEVWKGEYTFDEQNNPLTETYSVLEEGATQLSYAARYEYFYDQEVLLSDVLAPSPGWFLADYSEQIVSKPLAYVSYEYNPDPAGFEIYYREVYYYNPAGFPLGVSNLSAPIASLFPNPVRESLTINFDAEFPAARFDLFDLSGKSVLQVQVENGTRLNLEELEEGVYLYRISAGELFQSGKLVKE
jgi:hypothetical protein